MKIIVFRDVAGVNVIRRCVSTEDSKEPASYIIRL